jgi:hypothetical protein
MRTGIGAPRGQSSRIANVIIAQAWRAAVAPLPALTGIPDRDHVLTHMAIHMSDGFRLYVEGGGFGPLAVTTANRPIQRWTSMSDPTEEELESVNRELARSAGLEAFEPPAAREVED